MKTIYRSVIVILIAVFCVANAFGQAAGFLVATVDISPATANANTPCAHQANSARAIVGIANGGPFVQIHVTYNTINYQQNHAIHPAQNAPAQAHLDTRQGGAIGDFANDQGAQNDFLMLICNGLYTAIPGITTANGDAESLSAQVRHFAYVGKVSLTNNNMVIHSITRENDPLCPANDRYIRYDPLYESRKKGCCGKIEVATPIQMSTYLQPTSEAVAAINHHDVLAFNTNYFHFPLTRAPDHQRMTRGEVFDQLYAELGRLNVSLGNWTGTRDYRCGEPTGLIINNGNLNQRVRQKPEFLHERKDRHRETVAMLFRPATVNGGNPTGYNVLFERVPNINALNGARYGYAGTKLLTGGVYQDQQESHQERRNARTAVGKVPGEAQSFYLILWEQEDTHTRATVASGIRLNHLATIMTNMQIQEALNLDGSGSAQFYLRQNNQHTAESINGDSQNGYRPVASSAIFSWVNPPPPIPAPPQAANDNPPPPPTPPEGADKNPPPPPTPPDAENDNDPPPPPIPPK